MKDISTGLEGLSPLGGVAFDKLKVFNANLSKIYTAKDYARVLTSGGVDVVVAEIPYIKSNLALYSAADFSLIKTASTTNGFGFVSVLYYSIALYVYIELVQYRTK